MLINSNIFGIESIDGIDEYQKTKQVNNFNFQ